MKQKIFFWTVKEYKNDYGTMYSLGMTKDDLKKLKFNAKWYANISIKQSKNGKRYAEVYQPKEEQDEEFNTEDELPF